MLLFQHHRFLLKEYVVDRRIFKINIGKNINILSNIMKYYEKYNNLSYFIHLTYYCVVEGNELKASLCIMYM